MSADATPEEQAPIVALVEQVLAALKADSGADVSALEKEIDKLVSRLYGIGGEQAGGDSEQCACSREGIACTDG